MKLGQVTGLVISTQKDEGLEGFKLLLVQELGLNDLKPLSAYLVALDTVGAGAGDVVLTVTGSSARFAATLRDRPVDAAIIGIVDQIEIDGKLIYAKPPAVARR